MQRVILTISAVLALSVGGASAQTHHSLCEMIGGNGKGCLARLAPIAAPRGNSTATSTHPRNGNDHDVSLNGRLNGQGIRQLNQNTGGSDMTQQNSVTINGATTTNP